MSTQANAMPESLDEQRFAAAAPSATRPLYWSIRRELWENRPIYIGPLAVAAVFLLGFLISAIGLPQKMHGLVVLDAPHQHDAVVMPYHYAAGLIMFIAAIVAVFYCVDALYNERRDRSILFWKSLPVSDLTTVLSKASIPLVVLPLLAFAVTVVTQFIMLLFSTTILLTSGTNVAPLWTQVSLFQMSLMLLYHYVTVHILWYAPLYGWLLLVSAWARRTPFLWAVLPPFAIAIFEKIAFHTSYFGEMLSNRFSGGMGIVALPNRLPIDPGMQLTPGRFLSDPALWVGLGVTAAFLIAAARLRRNREPI